MIDLNRKQLPVNFNVPTALKQSLQEMSTKSGMSISEILRRSVSRAVEVYKETGEVPAFIEGGD